MQIPQLLYQLCLPLDLPLVHLQLILTHHLELKETMLAKHQSHKGLNQECKLNTLMEQQLHNHLLKVVDKRQQMGQLDHLLLKLTLMEYLVVLLRIIFNQVRPLVQLLSLQLINLQILEQLLDQALMVNHLVKLPMQLVVQVRVQALLQIREVVHLVVQVQEQQLLKIQIIQALMLMVVQFLLPIVDKMESMLILLEVVTLSL